MNFELENEETKMSPLEGRPSISILLGAGFSAPMGYPIGNTLNEKIRNFDDSNLDFSPSGEIAVSTNGMNPVSSLVT